MGMHASSFSRRVTGGNPLDFSQENYDTCRLHQIISQLGLGTHYIQNPGQAVDLLSNYSRILGDRTDADFYLGILYVLREYVNGDDNYNTSGQDPDNVVRIRNAQGIISQQVLQVLQNPSKEQSYEIDIKITDINFDGLSAALTELITNADLKERNLIQPLKNLLIERLNLDTYSDWNLIIRTIEKQIKLELDKKEA